MKFAKASKTRVILIGRKSEKSVIHVQSCWLANIKILLFCRSRCGFAVVYCPVIVVIEKFCYHGNVTSRFSSPLE